MKRSMFLDLCVQAAVKKDKPKVLYAGIEYYPEGYELRFDKSGKAVHRAILRDASKHNCLFTARWQRCRRWRREQSSFNQHQTEVVREDHQWR